MCSPSTAIMLAAGEGGGHRVKGEFTELPSMNGNDH